MKKIIFFALLALGALQAGAQEAPHYQKTYVPLADCNNDPFYYIEVNYVYLKEQHMGQTVYDFAQQFELPVAPVQVCPRVYLASEAGDGANDGYYTGFYLDFYYENIKYSIGITLAPPYTNHEEDPNSPLYYMSDEEVPWSTYYNTLFRNAKIMDMWVYKEKDGEYVSKTYVHHRDYYGIPKGVVEIWLLQP